MLQTPRSLEALPEIVCDATSGATPEEVVASQLFLKWLSRLQSSGIRVERVRIYVAHKFGTSPDLKMIHLYADAYDAEGNKLPGIVTLRGDTVDVLAILRAACSDDQYVVLVAQPRVAGAQHWVVSNTSGMIDNGEFIGAAALRELTEETGTGEDGIRWSEPVDLGARITETDGSILVSPGGSDERARFVYTTATVPKDVLVRLHGRFGGLQHEGERTAIILVPLEDALWRLTKDGGSVDLKTLTSLLLYRELRTSGRWLP